MKLRNASWQAAVWMPLLLTAVVLSQSGVEVFVEKLATQEAIPR